MAQRYEPAWDGLRCGLEVPPLRDRANRPRLAGPLPGIAQSLPP